MTQLDDLNAAVEVAKERQQEAWDAWKTHSASGGKFFERRAETMSLMRQRDELAAQARG